MSASKFSYVPEKNRVKQFRCFSFYQKHCRFSGPANVLFLALASGVGLLWTRYKRLARWWLTATVLLTVFLTVVPVGRFLMNILENRFEPASSPNDVEGVIVLGGVHRPVLSGTGV